MPDASDARARAEEILRRALEQRSEILRERLGQRWRDALEEVLSELPSPPSLEEGLFQGAPATSEGPIPTDRGTEVLASLESAVSGLSQAEDQVTLLSGVLSAAEAFAGRVVLFLVRRERAIGWTTSGFPGVDVRSVDLPLDGASPLARALRERRPIGARDGGDAAPIWEALGAGGSEEHLTLPLTVKGRVAALLFADAGEAPEAGALVPDALRIVLRFVEVRLSEIAARGATPAGREPAAAERRPSESWEQPAPVAAVAVATQAAPDLPAEPPASDRSGAGDAANPHAEAKRFARLLVSEILLYNEAQVAEGREHGDLWERLREDLERSEQMYRQRVPAEVVDSVDYFQEEVVRTLANGNPALLGAR